MDAKRSAVVAPTLVTSGSTLVAGGHTAGWLLIVAGGLMWVVDGDES